MAPFEALYGRKCRTPLCWEYLDANIPIGPNLIQETVDQVKVIQGLMKRAQDRQNIYNDNHRRKLEFEFGQKVFLKVSPMKGVKRFRVKGKLSPKFIGPFEILRRIGEVAYELALPPELDGVKELRNKSIPLVKVLWTHHGEEEATWEKESDIRSRYPHLF
ncbi:uncharacterized protein LOC130828676 [Amaranthus tricolor]|uniref:uncharacterized protein LOC130828676 n=1 Tax=Amaranthus tricolor TaxID=29722 RepID=UPI002585F382|nr:uncharacterized protein LOC130828676 [Amaranthus tricolor]